MVPFKSIKQSFWVCAITSILILTIVSAHYYGRYLQSRRNKITETLSSLRSTRLGNRTHHRQFESTLLPQHLTQSIQHYLAQDLHQYLIVTCETGIGNRLQTIVSAFLMAMLTHRRLVIHWPVTALSSCQYDQLFEPQLATSLDLFALYTDDHDHRHSALAEFHGPFDELLCHSDLTRFEQQSQFLFVITDEYFMSVLMKNPSYGQTLLHNTNEDFLFRSLVNYLFVPIKALQDEILNKSSEIGPCDRGIQMRRHGLKQIPVHGEELFLSKKLLNARDCCASSMLSFSIRMRFESVEISERNLAGRFRSRPVQSVY